MPKRRPRQPARRPRPGAAAPSTPGPLALSLSKGNPDLAFARTIQTGGAWFPSVWPM